jgi:hypothetical protein
MGLKSATNGSTSGTGTVELDSTTVGGVLVSTDGTNAAVVVVKDGDNNGDVVVSYSGLEAIWIDGQFYCQSGTAYYSITGTGASAQIFAQIH